MSGIGLYLSDKSFLCNKDKRTTLLAILSLAFNSVYAMVNICLGFSGKSSWLITVGAYYLILAVMRFGIILTDRNNEIRHLRFIRNFTGTFLIVLSFVLSISVYLSITYDVTKNQNEIFVITMATYSFAKITLAIINFIKRKKLTSPVLSLIKNIGLADAAVSIFSLQKSMLVSFPGMQNNEIRIMNICTGSAVCILVMLTGIGIIYSVTKKQN